MIRSMIIDHTLTVPGHAIPIQAFVNIRNFKEKNIIWNRKKKQLSVIYFKNLLFSCFNFLLDLGI